MEKNLNIEEQKVMAVKVKEPRYDMSGMIDAPAMPKTGKLEKVCNRKKAKITNTSGWMCELPMTEEQKQEMEQATERMRQRYIAAGMRTSL